MTSEMQDGEGAHVRNVTRSAARFKARWRDVRGKSRAGSADDVYDFGEPVGRSSFSADPMVAALTATAAFRRLSEVRFLGGIDYLLIPTPNGTEGYTRYTRYQHSLGVAWLAQIYATAHQLSGRNRRLVIAAALLHDIGHCPLSHTLEPVFTKHFGIGHHLITEQLIHGQLVLGRELSQILRSYGVDLDEITNLLSGRDASFDQFFSGPISFDTIEGILRSWSYVQYERRFLSPRMVLEAAIRRETNLDRSAVDAFWGYKDRVYRFLIRSPRGVVADHLCQQALRADIQNLLPEDFLATERELCLKCPTLGSMLRSGPRWPMLERALQEPISYQSRKFFIDGNGDFFQRHDNLRYKQLKEEKSISYVPVKDATLKSGNLFDADCF